jgi:hypothetical protein
MTKKTTFPYSYRLSIEHPAPLHAEFQTGNGLCSFVIPQSEFRIPHFENWQLRTGNVENK